MEYDTLKECFGVIFGKSLVKRFTRTVLVEAGDAEQLKKLQIEGQIGHGLEFERHQRPLRLMTARCSTLQGPCGCDSAKAWRPMTISGVGRLCEASRLGKTRIPN